MTTSFTVFGACASRDIFFSKINKNYKDYFSIGEDGLRLSYISIMQKPLVYNDEDLKIFPENKTNYIFSESIKKDLDKVFLKILKENNFEYLILDTYYDVNFGIIEIDGNNYITNNLGLSETSFFKNLKNKRILNMWDDTKEYYDLWTENCDLFFKFLQDNSPDTKVILNPFRHVYKMIKYDGSIIENQNFKHDYNKFNKYRDILDKYILENFDVDILEFDDTILANESHIWGKMSVHYETKYYTDITNQLNEIIKRNKLLDSYGFLNLNKEIRKIKRKKLLFELNNYTE